MGQTFQSICKLWVIAQEVAIVYFDKDDTPVCNRVPLAFAEAKFRKLLAWMSTLDAGMARRDHCPSHVIIFHILFHIVAIHIFLPFAKKPQSYRLRSFTSPDCYAEQIYATSITQLKRITFWYHANYKEAACTSYFNGGLVLLCNAVFDDWEEKQDSPEYFLLYLHCWQNLYTCFPMFHDVVRAFLAMALRKGLGVSGQEAEDIMLRLKQQGRHHEDANETILKFITDFNLVTTAPDESKNYEIARKFDDLVLLDKFTNALDKE